MPLFTKRWNDPAEEKDGKRILITRYRPRALPKKDETWDEWMSDLAPSAELLAAFHGKNAAPIGWSTYRSAYLREMHAMRSAIEKLAQDIHSGQTITLLCSSACTEERRFHRSLLRDLIEAQVAKLQSKLE